MSEAAIETVKNLDIKTHVTALLKIYQETLR
jgi:hypothetical protein